MKKDNFTYPGELLCAIEESAPGKGVYEKGGEIFAVFAGRIIREHGEISVIPKKEVEHIHPEQIVYAIVASTKDTLALLEIHPLIKGRGRFSPALDYGILRVTDIAKGYVKSVKNEMKIGDIIRARVKDIREDISLSINEFNLGVVFAYCTRCRSVMDRIKDQVKCRKCGNIEKRKLSNLYAQTQMLDEIEF